jgi:hypothetical protein|nr:MAG TPA: hypothetical protein [Caudoviricetes sp.]
MNKSDLISLPITDNMMSILEVMSQVHPTQVAAFIEDFIIASARRAQMDMTLEQTREKLKMLTVDLYKLSQQVVEPSALAVLLRETMEEYGEMIIVNHIPIQDITFIYHDTLTMNFQNREDYSDGTTT